MATALSAQLAAIAAKSTNQLDLKAQRRAHSQSLIFEPRDAAVQDFDTIYDVCVEGFRELCLLEPRFVPFSRNIFADHSKGQDRSQMTSAQNEELDAVVERFLYLVGSKALLLLQPAIKAIEWLVRRFRVHEHNTLCLILTFLPYHTLPIFVTLLSIVPKKLSPATKFLHPYHESLASPPRHVIAYAATNNVAFFTAWNNYVVKSCRERSLSQRMISYWATTMTEAVTGQLDQAASARREAQRQKEEDVLLRILPVLDKGLAMRSEPDMRVGCYMILSVLASRANLDDKVLIGLIEAVLNGGTKETSHAELICIAVLAQQRDSTDFPPSVYQRLMSIDTLVDDLVTMSERYRVSHLAFSLASGSIHQAESGRVPQHQSLIASCSRNGLLAEIQISILARRVISFAKATESSGSSDSNVVGYLARTIQDLLASDVTRSIVEHVLEESHMELQHLELLFNVVFTQFEEEETMAIEQPQIDEPAQSHQVVTYDVARADVLADLSTETPLLHDVVSEPFNRLAVVFNLALRDDSNSQDFFELPLFQGPGVSALTFASSFFARFWCSSFPSIAKVAALDGFSEFSGATGLTADTQFVLPYALHALSDPSSNVRSAAVRGLLSLGDRYRPSEKSASMTLLGKDNLYCANIISDISWLSQQEVATLLHDVLFPELEECVIDREHILNILRDSFNKTQKVETTVIKSKARKSSFRASLLRFITSHIIGTPLYSVKYMLLRVLDGVSRAGGITKTELLLPLLRTHLESRESDIFDEDCQRERLDPRQFASELVRIVSPSSREGNELLQTILCDHDSSPSELLESAIFQHVRATWDSMRPESQQSWSTALFDTGAFDSTKLDKRKRSQSARDVLQSVTLSTDSLLDYLGMLPRLVAESEQQAPSSKRRKIGQGIAESRVDLGEKQLSDRLGKTVSVLELIESSKHGNDVRLLPHLFQILHDLQRCVTVFGNDMGYALSTLLRSMTRITEHSRSSRVSLIEQQSTRVDLVIDCFKNTGSLQVQQEALRLLSSLALLAPDLIVHSVMPIFTFMGGSLLRQNDEHSARIVDSTIESVIPPLISTFRKRKGGLLGGAAELILSFAAAFEHIPVHRRLGLLSALMNKLGEEEYLHVLLIILADRHGRKPAILEFCTDMMLQYPAIVQLRVVKNCMEVAIDSFKPEPRMTLQILSSDRGKERDITCGSLIELSSHLLLNPQLSSRLAKILSKDDEGAEEIRTLYSRMVEQGLHLTEEAKPNPILHGSCRSLLHALSDFLPLSASLSSLRSLLEHENEALRRQVLRSFERRIKSARPGDSATEKACFDLLPRLLSLLDISQDVLLKRTAIAIIDRIADKYGKRNTTAVNEAATAISGNSCLGSEDQQLQVMALLCIITLVEVLRESIVPVIPSILHRSLDLLALSVLHNEDQKPQLHNAVFRFFDALFLYLPWIVTGEHLHRLLELSYESACSDMSNECDQIRAASLDLLAKQVEAHECINTLRHTWDEAVNRGIKPVLEHLKVLENVVERHPKSTIVKESQLLMKHILAVMDLRRTQEHPQGRTVWNAQHLQRVESTSDGITIQVIYKLNDTHFRPLFVTMSDWATEFRSKKERAAKTCRELSWFSFLQHFFSTLESIVTGYAAYVLDEAVDILLRSHDSFADDSLLRERVLETLHAMFEYDQDEFWRSTSRFDTICSPLLGQLKHSSGRREPDSTLISCITAFATATDSPDHLKIINSKILEHLRSDAAKVRLAAIRCEISLTESLGEEWLSLLPEMLPAISEAMEDDDENVENEARKWAKQIEGILGESLDEMLQ